MAVEPVTESGATPQELVVRIERLLDEVEQLPDPRGRETALGAVQALLDLYGEGLRRVVEALERYDGGLLDVLTDDELVSHLLMLHGLHPLPLGQRVAAALDEVRPYLQSHGGEVELLSVSGETVRLRLQGSCSGCPSSTMTLKLAIENAIHKAAPEIERVVAEDGAAASSGLLQIEVAPRLGSEAVPGGETVSGGEGLGAAVPGGEGLGAAVPGGEGLGAAVPGGEWTMVGGLPELSSGGVLLKAVAGQPILFLSLDGRFYGYRHSCPVCGESLETASLTGYELTCAGCGSRFDALRAGRCLDSPQLHLEPVPLLVTDDGLVKVALLLPA